jgi:hypothetical protein
MADHIPFVTGEDGGAIAKNTYRDADIIRMPLDRAERFAPLLTSPKQLWLDPCVDGLHDLETRRSKPGNKRPWFEYMKDFTNFEKIGLPSYQAKPLRAEVHSFVKAILDACALHKPAWITVPQLPLVDTSERNKINRSLAEATGSWRSTTGYHGRLILPLVFTHQDQVNLKTARNPKVQQAAHCYRAAQADGLWVVDKSLTDDSGSSTLRNKRFPGIIGLHEELNACMPSKIRIAGPYWGLNLLLWARGLVDYPAIGIGSGYQFFMAGGHTNTASAKLALPSLRRRVGVGPQLKAWLDEALAKLAPSHPMHQELSEIKKQYPALSQAQRAREQVATFYKSWFDAIAGVPKAGRSMALFQDLSAAYALGKGLPELVDEGTARRPEAVAEQLMLSCL